MKTCLSHLAAGLALSAVLVTPVLAADAAKGERVAKLCAACHSFTDATNKTGPSLKGVVGRAIGSAAGFTYSADMLAYAAKEKTWDEARLDAYIKKPKAVVPMGSMAFGGIAKQADRENLIAYLKTLTP